MKIHGVDIVIGTAGKLDVVGRVEFMLDNPTEKAYSSVENLDEAHFEPMTITKAPRTRAYVKIEDGCESKCTYCAISPARGRVRSKLPEEVISEVEGLYKSGTREIVLTGIEMLVSAIKSEVPWRSSVKDAAPKTSLFTSKY